MEKPLAIDATQHAVMNMEILQRMRKKHEQCDFEIRVGTTALPVHKLLLSMRSEYFAAMFKHENRESSSGYANMKDVDAEAVEKCIDYIYTGKASVKEENIGKLLHVSVMMQLNSLTAAIVSMLKNGISPVSFFQTKRLAITYNCKTLEEDCDKFALANFEKISISDEFGLLEKDYVTFLVRSNDNKASAMIKCDAVFKWINYDMKKRKKLFLDLLHGINLSKIPLRHLKHYVDDEELVHGSMEAMKLFTQAFFNVDRVKSDAILVFDKPSKSVIALSTEDGETEKMGKVFIQDMPRELLTHTFNTLATPDHVYMLLSNGAMYRSSFECDAALEKMPDVPYKEICAMAAACGNIYIIDHNREVKFYDGTGKKWRDLKASQIRNIQLHDEYECTDVAVAVLADWIYLIGGKKKAPNYYDPYRQYQEQASDTVQALDLKTGVWQFKNPSRHSRYGAAAATHGGTIYVLGGYGHKNQPLAVVEKFSPATDQWTVLQKMTVPRANFRACSSSGKLYAIGGNGSKQPRYMEVMTTFDGQWRTVAIDAGLKLDQTCITFRMLA